LFHKIKNKQIQVHFDIFQLTNLQILI